MEGTKGPPSLSPTRALEALQDLGRAARWLTAPPGGRGGLGLNGLFLSVSQGRLAKLVTESRVASAMGLCELGLPAGPVGTRHPQGTHC